MKVFMKIIVFLLVIVFLSVFLYIGILSKRGELGFLLAFVVDCLFIVVMVVSIIGMVKGNIKFLRIKNRVSSFGIFCCAIFFIVYASSLGFLSILIGEKNDGKIPSVKESALTLIGTFVPIGYREGLLTERGRGVTFRFPEGEEVPVNIIKTIYPQVKERVNKVYGENNSSDFTVMIYDNIHDFYKSINSQNVTGFYSPISQTISLQNEKLVGSLISFQDNFVHEYTHYRTHQFLKQNGISFNKIPAWFNEGISMLLENQEIVDTTDLQTVVDFKKMDTNEQFQGVRSEEADPYLQSYFAVKELVLANGVNVIPNIMLAMKDKDFYHAFHEVTGRTIEEFQGTFLNGIKQNQNLFIQASEALVNDDFANAEKSYLKVIDIDADFASAYEYLGTVYIRQKEFEKGMNILKKQDERGIASAHSFQLLSHLSLLINPTDSEAALQYAKEYEQQLTLEVMNSEQISNLDHIDSYIKCMQEIQSEPIKGYKQLFDGDFIFAQEIKEELLKKLKQQYPHDSIIQNISD